jgi:hypothetical protein
MVALTLILFIDRNCLSAACANVGEITLVLRLSGLLLVVGSCFFLDWRTQEIELSSPTPQAVLFGLRVTFALTFLVAGWILIVLASGALSAGEELTRTVTGLALELFALACLSLAGGIIVRRLTSEPGLAAALVALATAGSTYFVPDRFQLLTPEATSTEWAASRFRWMMILIIGIVAMIIVLVGDVGRPGSECGILRSRLRHLLRLSRPAHRGRTFGGR